jgi:WD40 repeat protein
MNTTHEGRFLLPHILASVTLVALAAQSGCNQTAMIGTDQDPLAINATGGTATSGGTVGGVGGAGGIGTTESPTDLPIVGTSCAPISLVPGVLNPCGHAYAVAYSPDGQFLATSDSTPSGSEDLHLWRLSDGMPVYSIQAHRGGCYDVAFSPDGKLLASAGMSESGAGLEPGMVKLWNAATGALVRKLPVSGEATSYTPYASSATFSHDGTLLATCGIGPIEIWRVADWTRVLSIESSGTVYQVRFSPDDSRLIAAGTDGAKARVFDAKTGRLLLDNLAAAGDQASADFSPDGTLIASNGYDGMAGLVHIWDASTGNLLQTMTGHIYFMGRVVWIDQNRLLSDDWDGKVIQWTRDASGVFAATRTWSAGSPLDGTADSINMAVSPDKTRVAIGGLVGRQGGFLFLQL